MSPMQTLDNQPTQGFVLLDTYNKTYITLNLQIFLRN